MTETQLLLVKFLVSMCSYNQILIVHHVCAFLKTFDLYFSFTKLFMYLLYLSLPLSPLPSDVFLLHEARVISPFITLTFL